jgi:hypothetical protein
MDHELKLLTEAGLPAPPGLLGKNIRLEIGTGKVWTTIISVSTIANDDGYPEFVVAPAYFRHDLIVSVQLREAGNFFCRTKFFSNGKERAEFFSCNLIFV